MDHKHLFGLLRYTEIEYCSGSGRIHALDHWWEAKIKENLKYAKYRNFICSEIYDTWQIVRGHRRLDQVCIVRNEAIATWF